MADKKTYSISQVASMLKDEFPDITVSKIRFLESEGLIKPARKPSGYRMFTEKDIEQLKKVLILQRDYFMPLNVIREKLQSGDLPDTVVTEVATSEGASLTASEVLDKFDVGSDFLDELEKFGLVQPENTPEGKVYTADDVAIIDIASRLRTFGLEPRHLRVIENMAAREALSFEQIIYPFLKQRTEAGIESARKAYEALINLSGSLHRKLIERTIKQRFPELFR